MIYNIVVNDIWACHIGFLSYLLKLKCNIISTIGNKFSFISSDYQDYYQNLCNVLYIETDTYYEPQYFAYYLQNYIIIYNTPLNDSDTIYLEDNNSIYNAEDNFYNLLNNNNIIKNLEQYGKNKILSMNVIKWCICTIYDRIPNYNEIWYYYNKNLVYRVYGNNNIKFINISLSSFLLNLRFYKEGRSMNYQWDFIQKFKLLKYNLSTNYIPKCAVILSGHTRNYTNTFSNMMDVIENPYMDIHIHTWNNRGIRMEFDNEKNDPVYLSNVYRPSTFQIDNVTQLDFNNFTLNNNSNLIPIFLYNGQYPSDDPPKYVNSQLYSTYQAYNNIISYENNNNFKYDCILRLKFDFNLLKFDKKQFSFDILGESNICSCDIIGQENYSSNFKNTLWFPSNNVNGHYWHGGGCRLCDLEKSLINHTINGHENDINDTFFYGRRNIVAPLCSFYLYASNIYQNFQNSNVINSKILLSNQIYISNNIQYQKPLRISQNNYIYTYTFDDSDFCDNIIPYHSNRLMKILLKSNIIRSSSSIDGTINDIFYNPFQIYNIC